MIKKTLKDIKLGSGFIIPAGTECSLTLGESSIKAEFLGRSAKLGYRNAKANFGAPFTKAPSLGTLEKWSDEGVARTTTGERTEPDGIGSNGAPSWMLALGVI